MPSGSMGSHPSCQPCQQERGGGISGAIGETGVQLSTNFSPFGHLGILQKHNINKLRRVIIYYWAGNIH